jgi:hypothetical protein
MKSVKKKSKIQMAREIIANLRQGMAMRREAESGQNSAADSMAQTVAPRPRFQPSHTMQTNRAW